MKIINICLNGLILVLVIVLLILQVSDYGSLSSELDEANAIIEDYRIEIENLNQTNHNLIETIETLQKTPKTPSESVTVQQIFTESVFPLTRRIVPGETLSEMIQRIYGIVNEEMVNWIVDINRLEDENDFYIGQFIVFPNLSMFEGSLDIVENFPGSATIFPTIRQLKEDITFSDMVRIVYGLFDSGDIANISNWVARTNDNITVGQLITFHSLTEFATEFAVAVETNFPHIRQVPVGSTLLNMVRDVYGVTNREIETWIARVNNIRDPNNIFVGQRITFPDLVEMPPTAFPHIRYVTPGDSLSVMIKRVYGTTSQELIEWIARVNYIQDPLNIVVGQEIIFPELKEGF